MDKVARRRTYLFAVVIGAALFLLTPALKADTLTMVLSPTTSNVSPGQSFTINGTLTQSVADSLVLSFNGIALNLNNGVNVFSGASIDPAYNTFSASFASGLSALTLYSGPILDLTVSPSAMIGAPFSGFVQVIATDSTTGLTLDTGMVPFTGTVVGVPEPSAFFLLGIGLLIMLGAARWRRPFFFSLSVTTR